MKVRLDKVFKLLANWVPTMGLIEERRKLVEEKKTLIYRKENGDSKAGEVMKRISAIDRAIDEARSVDESISADDIHSAFNHLGVPLHATKRSTFCG